MGATSVALSLPDSFGSAPTRIHWDPLMSVSVTAALSRPAASLRERRVLCNLQFRGPPRDPPQPTWDYCRGSRGGHSRHASTFERFLANSLPPRGQGSAGGPC